MAISKSNLKFARDIAVAAERSPYIWAVSYIALPKGVHWTFEDRKWQIDIIDDLHPEVVVRKPTQVGLTITSTTKSLWFASQHKSRVMYTLPRRDDVTDYVSSILNPMIEGSDYLSGRIGKTDTLRMKRIGDSYYHVTESTVAPRMLQVDLLVNDEVDLSDPDNFEQFIARLDASPYQYHYQFSTPTVSGYGIDAAYERSDRREWTVTCSRCNAEQFLDWEEQLVRQPGRLPYLACNGCRNPIRNEDIIDGKWIVTNPSSSVHGYCVSHLMLPITRPLEQLVRESDIIDKKTFYNLRLGKPWRPIGGSMPFSLFRDNSFRSGHPMQTHRENGYKYYVGADQGNEIHVAVGRVPDGDDRLEVVYLEHIKPARGEDQFERLGAIVRMFDADFVLCDANPNRQSIYNLAQSMHGKIGAADIGAFSYPFKWHGFNGDSAYKLICNRTDILDGLRDDISSGKMSFWGTWETRPPILKEAIRQCGNLKRDTAKRKLQSGGETVVGVWRKTGDDHFAFSLSLLRVAAIISPSKSNFDFAVVGSNPVPEIGDNGKVVKSRIWKDTVYYVGEDGQKEQVNSRFF